ncbi:MAG: transposase, partial [Chloroflexota bacterium]|nr:transposase [Chloroflexota bacterium]
MDGRRLKVFGIGRLAVRWHRPLDGTPKTLRLTRKAGQWYATFSCVVASSPLPQNGRAVGIDVGLTHLVATSDGATVAHPHWYREGQRRLRVLHRTVARRKRGSVGRRTAIRVLQRHHERLANGRK